MKKANTVRKKKSFIGSKNESIICFHDKKNYNFYNVPEWQSSAPLVIRLLRICSQTNFFSIHLPPQKKTIKVQKYYYPPSPSSDGVEYTEKFIFG